MNVLHNKMTAGAYVPGVYDSYTNAEYHAAEGISKSGLDLIHKSPAHYKAALTLPHIETPALRLGTALHTLVLEPARFVAEYDFIDGDRRLKATKDAIKEAEAAGKIILTKDEFDAVSGMRDSIFSRKIARALINGAAVELSVFSELDGVRVKCRPDGWRIGGGILFDLKTTADASPAGFARSVAKYRYHVQEAFYRHVVASITGDDPDKLVFVFIAVENKPPYEVALYNLDEMAQLQGIIEAREDLRRYREAKEKNDWHGYSPLIEKLSLPRWAAQAE